MIRYAYLWRSEADRGRDSGAKDRPCVVVLAVKRQHGVTKVVVAPITHSIPAQNQNAIEIPSETKRRLKLDNDRSWIMTTELNVFEWPGPDLRPTGHSDGRPNFAYGYLPETITRRVIDTVRELVVKGEARTVNRD